MGRKAKFKREKKQYEKEERKKFLEQNYDQKNPWLKFWKRFDFWIYIVCLIALIAFPFISKKETMSKEQAILKTSMGEIKIQLFSDDAPQTVENFQKLASEEFYNGLTWHRVIENFMIQTGDPNGDGTGGPGYTFADEINDRKIMPGTVAMANSGPDTNGSQFFIVTKEPQPHLDGKYTVFGEVIEGMEIVQLIGGAPTDENNMPLTPIYLESVEIE